MTQKDFLGSALPKRQTQKSDKFKNTGGFVSSIDATDVTVRTRETGSSYQVPTLDGVEFDRMRRYGLVLTRWSLHDPSTYAKRWKVSEQKVVATSRLVSNSLFKDTFDGEDPTVDTINVTPYINAYKSLSVTDELVTATLALTGTQAFDTIVNELDKQANLKDVVENLKTAAEALTTQLGYSKSALNGLHSKHPYYQKQAIRHYRAMVNYVDHYSAIVNREAAKAREKKAKRSGKPTAISPSAGHQLEKQHKAANAIVRRFPEVAETDWMTPYVAKYPLELPHTGKAGRRLIATNEGKYPKAFYRLVTDPYRRIFQRKTRALGGVVVIDCSGSMSLSDDDIHQMLKASAGCTIICYSSDTSSETADAKYGNIHLVAKNGRQMRGLPEFAGGNGVDLPALRYGYEHHRLNGKSPVIWISDGQVTGKGDKYTDDLARDVSRYNRRKGIKQVRTPKQAVKLLAKLQKGISK
jgi:hypothetical protein